MAASASRSSAAVLVERERRARAPGARTCGRNRASLMPAYTATQRACRPSSRSSETSIGSRASASIAQAFSSYGLIVGCVFGERQLHADEAVHVAVGHVVHHLAHGPSAGAIGRVELASSRPATAARSSAAARRCRSMCGLPRCAGVKATIVASNLPDRDTRRVVEFSCCLTVVPARLGAADVHDSTNHR